MPTRKFIQYSIRPKDVRTATEAFLLAVEWARMGPLSTESVKQLTRKVQGDADRLAYPIQGNRPDKDFSDIDALAILESAALASLDKIRKSTKHTERI